MAYRPTSTPRQRWVSSARFTGTLHLATLMQSKLTRRSTPGTPGGPLVSLDGKLLGINGKIETRFGLSVNSGVGYAVPSNQIARFLKPLKNANGGVIASGMFFGLRVLDRVEEGQRGLPVRLVVAGSQAFKAGFRNGDRILSIDDYPVTTKGRFLGILKTYPEGSQVEIRMLRDGKESDILATLASTDKPVKLGIMASLSDDDEKRPENRQNPSGLACPKRQNSKRVT